MMMKLSNILFLLLFLVPFVYLFLHKLLLRNRSRIRTGNVAIEKQMLPPGRNGWPLFGESLDYFFKVRKGVLYEFVTDRMNRYSTNVFKTSLIGQPVAVLCNAEGNKFLFSNENKLVQTWWPTTIDKIFPKPDNKPSHEHSKRIRKMLPLALKADSLKEYVGMMDAVMKQHLPADSNRQKVNVSEMVKSYTFTLASNIFLGINDPGKVAELAKLSEDAANGIHSLPLNLPGTALNRGIKASQLMRKEVEAMIRQRKIDPLVHSAGSSKNFMSHMLMATDDNGQYFTEEEIASHLVGLLNAGYTTLHPTITLIMMYLAELPEVYSSVLREQKEIANAKEPLESLSWEDLRKMKYSWNVACEVLRLLPPGTGSFKEALTDLTFEGYTIPKGWKIHWMFDITHKNPEYFPNPEKFDPSRFQGDGPAPYTFVPFGGGLRMCPGYEYAKQAILIFLHNVVIKYRWEKLIPNEKLLYNPVPGPAQGLPVCLHPHDFNFI